MRIADIVTRNVVTVSPAATLQEAALLIVHRHISCVVVVEENRPVGIVTEQDLVRAGVEHVDASTVRIGDFIHGSPISIELDRDVYSAFDFLVEHHIRHLIVTAPDGSLEGVVTFTDIIRSVSFDDFMKAKLVSDEMSAVVAVVEERSTVREAMDEMNRHAISCVVVVDGKLPLGIFTERDAARMVADREDLEQLTMAQVMSAPLKTMPFDATLMDASDAMRRAEIRRMVIVDEAGRVAGILTQFDVIRGLEVQRMRHFRRLHENTRNELAETQRLLAERSELERIVSASPAVLYRCEYRPDSDADVGAYAWHPSYFSPQVRALTGFDASREQDIGWWLDRVHPEDLGEVEACLRQIAERGERDLVYRIRDREGAWRWILDHARVIRDEQGEPLEMIGSWLDVSERHQIEERQHQSEAKYRKLFDEALDMIHITDAAGVLTDINRAELARLGYEREELIGRSVLELIDPLYRDGCVMAVGKVLAGEAFSGYETVFLTKNGEQVHVEISATPQLDAEGGVIAARAIMHDISSRKRAELQLQSERASMRAILNNMPFLAWLKDDSCRYLAVNDRLAEICGFEHADMLVGKCDDDIWPAELAQAYREDDLEVMAEGISKQVEEPVEINGKRSWVETIKSPVFDSAGRVVGTVGLARDVSERINVEHERLALLGCYLNHQQAVNAIASIPASSPLDEKLRQICESSAGVLGADRVSIWLLNEDHSELRCLNLFEREHGRHSVADRLSVRDYPNYFEALEEGRSIDASDAINDLRTGEFADGYLQSLGIASMLDSAIYLEGRVAGVLCHEYVGDSRDWFGDEVMFSGDMATQVSLALQANELLRAVTALRQSESKLRSLIATIPDLVWVKDLEGRYLTCNYEFERFFSASEAEIVGKTDYDFISHTLADFFREHDRMAIDAGRPVINEEWVEYASDGHRALLETIKTPVTDADGVQVGVLGIGRDITERRQGEEHMRLLRSAVASVNESIIITDVDGVIEYVNPAFSINTGFTAEEAIGKTPGILNSKQQQDSFYTEFWRAIESGRSWAGRILDRKKDGTIFPVHLSVAPIFDKRGEITHYVAVHEDLTQAEEMQNQLMQSQKMEAVGTLVGGVAHDFNNLLASIVGNLYLMRKQFVDDEKTVRRIRGMEASVQHGAHLVRQMLTFARKDHSDKRVINLVAFIKEACKLAHAAIPENILFRLDYEPGLELWVDADSTQMQQVLLNLINNAQHAVRGRVDAEIVIEVGRLDPDSEIWGRHVALDREQAWCVLRCRDNGCGISAGMLDRVFEPFFTTKEVGEGTGLGLAMVYGAVQNHSGVIDVESSQESGTTVTICLPATERGKNSDENRERMDVTGNGRTILLVDDESGLRSVLTDVFTQSGFQVIEAADGEQAVDRFERHRERIALVLMDVVMPNMGGVAAAARIRDMDADVPIVFQTGHGEQTRLDAADAIANSISIQKPVQMPTLMHLARELIGA